MDSLVIHRRGDPFYQIIGGKKKFSSYTSGARGKSNRIDDLSKDKTSTFEKVNGWVIAFIFLIFLGYMGLVVAGS